MKRAREETAAAGAGTDGDDEEDGEDAAPPHTALAARNPHPRDARIAFADRGHKYTIYDAHGAPIDTNKPAQGGTYLSVTAWVGTGYEEFDAPFVAGCRPALDRHYNGRWTREALAAGALSPLTPELEHFLVFQEDYAHLKVHRTEWFIFDERLRLCGAIDVVYWDERLQAYVIYDYKRARDLKLAPAGAYDTKYGTSLATAHTYDTNYWHYCVQLMAYKLILERNYGIAIAEMWLIWLHPFQPSYRLLQVHWDAPLMAALVAQRQLDLLAPWAPQAPPGAPEPVDTA